MIAEGELIAGRYRLGEPIGRGRRGFVWLAHDERLQRTVAAKPVELPRTTTVAAARHARDRALRQARQASRIRHPGVVTVYDVVPGDDDIWLITEFVPARPMSDFLGGNGTLTAAQTASIGAQVASALVAALEHGVVHQAVEPATVLLADDGGVQLTDFGIGAATQDQAYRAPEVLRGQEATRASDVFSLGATLFRAVAGATAFDRLGTGSVPPVLRADPGLGQVLHRMLAADPLLRPTTQGVAEALSALADGREPDPATLVGPPPPPAYVPRPVPPVSRRTHPPVATQPPGPVPPPAAEPHGVAADPVARRPAAVLASAGMTGMTSADRSTGAGHRTVLVGFAVLAAALAGILFTEFFLLRN